MSFSKPVQTQLRGIDILRHPLLNKGTAFTQEERDHLGLNGLLPVHISSVEEQITRSYENFNRKRSSLGKYESLIALLSRNEHLFYQFVSAHAEEMLPYIYTPTVGEAAISYSQIYFQQRGLYLAYPMRQKLDEIFANSPLKEVDVIVVTDGERILGLGDQGIGGMVIPVGKLSLYTLFGGIHPSRTLPIFLDVGTNNPDLLKDPLYLGWRQKRLEGKEYDDFIALFIQALHKRYPNALLQWEDFGKNNARRLLDRYRKKLLSFNDDIQGTAAVTVAAILGAVKVAKQTIQEQTVAILGGGSAGTGIADTIVQAMVDGGLPLEEARRKIFILDIDGLIHFNSAHVTDAQKPYVQPAANLKTWKIVNDAHISLADVVANAHPTILIGVSAQGGAFTKEIVEEMARHTKRPILLPLSNPTSKSECTPQEVFDWTQGRGIVATGSPFQPVTYQGKSYEIGQCNNVYIFPGMGLGALVAQAREITDGMFLEATKTLASLSPTLKDPTAPLFPKVGEVRGVTRQIALAVAKKACAEGVGKGSPQELERRLEELMWEPSYPKFL